MSVAVSDFPPQAGIAAMLGRDRFMRYAALLLAALCLPLLVPVLPQPIAAVYAGIPERAFAILTIAACLYRLGALRSSVERKFWILVAVAYAAPLLPAGSGGFGFRVLRDAGDGAPLLLLAAAIELQPHAAERPGRVPAARLFGAVLLTLTLFACWIAIPWSSSDPAYGHAALRLTFLLTLHGYLVLRLFALRGNCADLRWRHVYGWLLATFALLVLRDALQILMRAGVLHEIRPGAPLDIPLYSAYAAVIVAARLREWTPREPDVAPPIPPDPLQALPAGPPLLLAAALVAIHLLPESLGLRLPRFHRWQELALLMGIIGLAALTRAHRMLLDRRTRRLAEEHRRAELDLRESHKAALEASRAKSRFLATVSHEMRTPLNAIIGMLELALRPEPAGERREYLRTARLSSDQLLHLINELLDLAKIESGTLAVNARPFSLVSLLKGCVHSLEPRARQKGLGFSFEMAEGVPDGVRGDEARVRQILLNLLDNAIKFTDEGRVRVSLRPAEGSPKRVHFEVSDTGIGIAPEDRERVFEPFTQADSSDARRYGGTGLGLAICRQLVERMRGRLWLESEVGRGSTFHVELDLQADLAGDALRAEDVAALRGVRLLVVHRDTEVQERLCRMLRESGLDPMLVEEPFLVPAMLREAERGGRPFRLILLDRHVRGAAALQARRPEDDPLVSRLPRVLISHEASAGAGVPSGTPPTLPVSTTERDLLRAIHDALEEGAPEPPGASAARVQPEPEERRLRVLVAEDNAVNALVVVRMLEMLGHEARVAEDGAKAVAALESDGYDAVLMDVQMPGMDGIEAMRRIRAREREEGSRRTRIVALTASAMKENAQRCLSAGADAFLTKPFQLEALRETLAGRETKPSAVAARAGTLDLPRLQAQLGNDPEGVALVFETFEAQAPDYLARLRVGVDTRDCRAVEQAAHKLKGALLWITADGAAEAASLLERLGASGDLTEAAEAVADLEGRLQAVREAIARSRGTGGDPA